MKKSMMPPSVTMPASINTQPKPMQLNTGGMLHAFEARKQMLHSQPPPKYQPLATTAMPPKAKTINK